MMSHTPARWMGAFVALLLLIGNTTAFGAQSTATTPSPAPSTSQPSPAPPPPASQASAAALEQLEGMVTTLEDPQARAKLVEQLKTLVAAQKGGGAQKAGAAAAPAESEEQELLPDALGTRALVFMAGRVEVLSRQFLQVVNAFSDLPAVIDWIRRQAEDPDARGRWWQLSLDLVMIIPIGAIALSLVGWLLRRPRAMIDARRYERVVVRLSLLFLRSLLELAPVVVFAAVSYGILFLSEAQMLSVGSRVHHVVVDIITATIIVQVVMVAAGFFFAPTAPGLRLTRMRDETTAYAYVWMRRLTIVGVYGYFLADGAFVFGLALSAYGALLKLLGLVMAGMLVILILQNRLSVAEWLRGNPLTGSASPDHVIEYEAEGQGAVLRSARHRLADVWHVLAIIYVLVAFSAWVLNVYGGFQYLVRMTIGTLAIFIITRLLVNGVNHALSRGFRISPELSRQFPGLEHRANRYIPVLHRIVKTAAWVVGVLMIFNIWGLDTVAWIETPIGRRVIRSVATISVMLAASIVAWEVVSAMIERFLRGTEVKGARIERSARMRTLLPLLRNAFLIVLVTMVSLITLAELGVNIAPLLAGAGVVGLAVGFGSQSLVKDVITGLFILFEDTISVGDVIDVGGGHSGVVEAISIRTIRLRDTAGAVHSVPFSAVTTVKNMTKDFSFSVFDVSVGYSDDPDQVGDVLKAIGAEMQGDVRWAYDILAPLEVMGIERFAESTVIIRARFKTRPLKQWSVGREFNRRMRQRFADLQISPYLQAQPVTVE